MTGLTLMLTLGTIPGMSQSETWCPGQIVYQVSPHTLTSMTEVRTATPRQLPGKESSVEHSKGQLLAQALPRPCVIEHTARSRTVYIPAVP